MPDPQDRLRDKRVKPVPHPETDDEPDEDELADEMARLMGQRDVSDYDD